MDVQEQWGIEGLGWDPGASLRVAETRAIRHRPRAIPLGRVRVASNSTPGNRFRNFGSEILASDVQSTLMGETFIFPLNRATPALKVSYLRR